MTNPPESAQRPDTDDYDLLTYGEVAARLTEELAWQQSELQRMRTEARPDTSRIGSIEERIATLQAGVDRYRREEHTNEFFKRKFGSALGSADVRG